MKFDILTLFPEMFTGPLTESIIKRAIQAGFIQVELHDIRAYATDKHRTADDAPYGGGAGMVMKAEPLAAAIRAVTQNREPRVRNQEPLRGYPTKNREPKIRSVTSPARLEGLLLSPPIRWLC